MKRLSIGQPFLLYLLKSTFIIMENLEINKLKISLAGQNLLTIFYAILTTLILSVIFISMLFMEIISYDAVLLIMCIIEFVMFILVLSNLYKAGTNLKNAVLVNLPNNQKISMADNIRMKNI